MDLYRSFLKTLSYPCSVLSGSKTYTRGNAELLMRAWTVKSCVNKMGATLNVPSMNHGARNCRCAQLSVFFGRAQLSARNCRRATVGAQLSCAQLSGCHVNDKVLDTKLCITGPVVSSKLFTVVTTNWRLRHTIVDSL